MRSLLHFAAVVLLLALSMDAAVGDGSRRSWRRYRYGIGAISHNVITPWYYGYYPTHYSYFPPDPMPSVQAIVLEDCWGWGPGYRCWACW